MGQAAQAFTEDIGTDTGILDSITSKLRNGAMVLENYACILEEAKAHAATLRSDLASFITSAAGNPSAATAIPTTISSFTSVYADLVNQVRMAAQRAAAALGYGSDGDSNGDGKLDTTDISDQEAQKIAENTRKGKFPNRNDIRQRGIGDCYFISTISAYAQTEEGRQRLQQNIRWDNSKKAFIVTLYKDGYPVEIEVDDYYSDGVTTPGGGPDIYNIYERAYGKLTGDEDLGDGGRAADVMYALSGNEAERIETPDWLIFDNHKYESEEWKRIEDAVESGRPVVAGTGNGDFGDGGKVQAQVDSNNNGRIDSKDAKPSTYTLAESHAYTVESIDDNYVTLRNPWDRNDNHGDGLIRITREEYEQHFHHTDIGASPSQGPKLAPVPKPSPGPAPTPPTGG